MGDLYKTPERMKCTIGLLREAEKDGLIDIATMEYGQYQPILANLHGDLKKKWLHEMGILRMELSAQGNVNPADTTRPIMVPGDRRVYASVCSLLDASVRKCFNEELCMDVVSRDKTEMDGDQDIHNIDLNWIPNDATNEDKWRLSVTIKCPPPYKKKR